MRNLKRIIALAATFALTLTSTAFASNFSDVADDSIYSEAIETLSKLNIFTGDDQDGDGVLSFRPDDYITRAEFAALIARIRGFGETGKTQTATEFIDVPSSHWASGYIAQAAAQGIVNGYGDGNFGPEDNVKYEEAIKMIMATLGYAPFANNNGGYPTGWLTAATKYDVTDDVQNTTTGVAATRGTIAQLLNNAIDTPLMESTTWSNNGVVTYVIYDGVDQPYETLMSEYLGITKLKGKVTSNSITTLTDPQDIDTSKEPEVEVRVTDNFNTTNKDFYDSGLVYKFNVADTDAEDYLGQAVIFYVKKNTLDDTYDIVSMASEAGKNTKVEFSLDKFDSVTSDTNGTNYIRYMKNDTDRNATRLTIQDGANIIYNNIAGLETFESLFGTSTSASSLIEKDGTVGGKVVLYDTDNQTGYDLIFVEVGATGVVDEVSNGKITFKNDVGLSGYRNRVSSIVVDADDTDVIVNITKEGKEISIDEINEWDVLSIVTVDPSTSSRVYNIEVLSGDKVIEGSISATSSSKTSALVDSNDNGLAVRINGTKYDVAEGSYKCDSLKVGNSGLFYVDAYGKIVAFNKDATSKGKANNNYAYVLDASAVVDNFGKQKLQLKLLTSRQGVVIWDAANKVKFESDNEKEENLDMEDEAEYLAEILKPDNGDNKTITYTLSGDKVKTITLDTHDSEEFHEGSISSEPEFDLEAQTFGKKDVDENTVVLFVDRDDNDNSEVGTIADLVDEETYAGAKVFYDDDDEDYIGLIVITDSSNKFGSSSSIAVINDVYESQNDDEEDVYTIEFFMDGEKKTAVTTADAYDKMNDNSESITVGDVYKFKFNAAGEIKEGKLVVDFADGVRDYSRGDLASAPTVITEGKPGTDEEYAVIPVKNYKSSTKTLTTDDNTYKLSKATNVYVIDPARSNNMVSVGGIGDIDYDKNLEKDNVQTVYDREGNEVAVGGDIDGVVDWVVIRSYDDKVAEVVIVKAYDYGILETNVDRGE